MPAACSWAGERQTGLWYPGLGVWEEIMREEKEKGYGEVECEHVAMRAGLVE